MLTETTETTRPIKELLHMNGILSILGWVALGAMAGLGFFLVVGFLLGVVAIFVNTQGGTALDNITAGLFMIGVRIGFPVGIPVGAFLGLAFGLIFEINEFLKTNIESDLHDDKHKNHDEQEL